MKASRLVSKIRHLTGSLYRNHSNLIPRTEVARALKRHRKMGLRIQAGLNVFRVHNPASGGPTRLDYVSAWNTDLAAMGCPPRRWFLV
jgi:hypothetical protein